MPLPQDASLLWKTLHIIFSIFRPLFCRLKVEGRENVPTSGGCVIACNHTMGPDFLFLGYASPRQINYMAKTEIFRMNPLLTKLFRSAGVFPIRRGQQDRVAIETAIRVVREGKVLGMFPEGTRSRNGALIRGKSGVARIAREADAPVIPTVVLNATAVLPNLLRPVRRPLVTVRFGKPMCWEGNGDEGEAVRQFTRKIMLEMAALMPEHLRGEYAHNGNSAPIEQEPIERDVSA